MSEFFRNILKIIAGCYRGYRWFWHVVAAALTYAIVVSGFDWLYYGAVRSSALRSTFFPAVVLGGLVPILVPLGLLAWGKAKRGARAVAVAWALGEAAIAGLAVSSFYKVFTGRVQPPHGAALVDNSREFLFGVLRHGVFWGWPSTHTTVAFAMAVALFMLFPKNRMMRRGALAYAFYVGIGVSVTGIHWFSEFIAGAIIGTVIGIAAAETFRREVAEA